VITALSAILDIDVRTLFDKAGVPIPAEQPRSTVEEALASLAPLPLEEPIEEDVEPDPVVLSSVPPAERAEKELEPVLDADLELEAEVREHLEDNEPERETYTAREPDPEFQSFSLRPETVGAAQMSKTSEPPAFPSPPEPFVITAPTPTVVEPSYMEDDSQRQLYRVRNLATVVLVIALLIILLWSLSNTLDAVGDWWDEFFRTLRV
jgi:hypothetical protein